MTAERALAMTFGCLWVSSISPSLNSLIMHSHNMCKICEAGREMNILGARAAAPEMDRTVANCLCCGNMYDCQEISSNDVKVFVGGLLVTEFPYVCALQSLHLQVHE